MTQITKEAIEAARAQMRPFIPPNDETLARAIEAALPFLPIAGEGKVKPLEWLPISFGDEVANTILGTYTITGGETFFVWFAGQADDEDYSVAAPSMEAAKSAAQSDFNTRILSALISSPGKDGGQEVEAAGYRWTGSLGEDRLKDPNEWSISTRKPTHIPEGWKLEPLYTRIEHKLKTIDRYFDAIRDGRKTFEVRLNDRAFQTGDLLVLQKIDEKGYFIPAPGGERHVPQTITKRVTYLLQGGQFGIEPRYCVLGLGEVDRSEE